MLTTVEPMLALAIVLTAGLLGGFVARRLGLPSVTGQILAGVGIGTSGLHLLPHEVVAGIDIITEFALAFIAASVGSHLQVQRLHNAGKRLFFLLLTESTVTPAIAYVAAVELGGADPDLGLLLAAMAISTAPATILAIVRETRSKGVFVKTLIAAVAFNNVACILLFEIARVMTRPDAAPGDAPPLTVSIDPFAGLLVALAVGAVLGYALVWATARTPASDKQTAMSLAALLAAGGVAEFLGISVMLTCLVFGAAVANLAPRSEYIAANAMRWLQAAIFAAFFTLAGMHLDFGHVVPAGSLAVAVLGGRFIGKLAAANLAMRFADATPNVRRSLGLALVPQAGVAVGLILLITNDAAFAEVHDVILAVGLSTVMVNELVGPLMTRHALKLSGDLGRDRARVIDFINEENITMDLRARTKREAFEQLVDLLIKSHHLAIDRDRFVERILEREAQGSTCIGEGLAIPHAVLEETRDRVVGVIGISREGLPFDSPDGEPVHCMVLLGTSASLTNRHLEVLGALARAMTAHKDLGHQLFTAKTPAHVYQLLHAEASEDFNYFLDDEVA